MTASLNLAAAGLYCPAGDFYIDPWQPVARALITHAHGDHARPGSSAYLAASDGGPLLAARLPEDAHIETIPYGERRRIGDVDVSFHPAGHVPGSAQIRIADEGETLVVSGDYKLAADPTCAPFEPVRCDTFVTESTFGLPIYRWDDPAVTLRAIGQWWQENRDARRASVLFVYALGKAQRVLRSAGPRVLPRRGGKFEHCLPRRGHCASADDPGQRSAGRHVVAGCPDPRATVGSRQSLAASLSAVCNRLCVGLDGDPRHAPARESGSRIRVFRSRRLARTQCGHRRHRRRARSG